ncbi:MAG: hypothetical protein EHM20_05005 [Alphaproteobacteria bacterium]|nr:MAG: hypothetical protein EHM20_05005 [Alphaproteobacteria bacterium]
MKPKSTFFIFVLTVLLAFSFSLLPLVSAQDNTANDDSDWYPFVIPEKLDPDSPVNIGKLVLDPPAGKHGFCKVKDGHFYFEDGTRAKFWGTNLVFGACFPSKEQAEILTNRLSFFGFNAVRLTNFDLSFEPKGIFKDIAPTNKDPQLKPTSTLSESQLDKLDYLIYKLKTQGIYINLNLLVGRLFTSADGVVDANNLGIAAKPICLFDKKLIQLQKEYANSLLSHYNPYTMLHYYEDPAIALVEIVNETTLFNFRGKLLTQFYQEEIDSLKKTWVKKAENKNKSEKDFLTYLEKSYFKEMTAYLKNTLKVKVPITGGHFSSPEAMEHCDFLDKHTYWDHPRFPQNFWDINNFIISNTSMILDKNLGIIKTFKELSHDKPFTITEWNHCYPNQYAYETPLIMASYALQNNADGLFQFSFSDASEIGYNFNAIKNFFNIASNSQQLILCSLGSFLFLKGEDITIDRQKESITIDSRNFKTKVGFINRKPLSFKGTTLTLNSDGVIGILELPHSNLQKNISFLIYAIGRIRNSNSNLTDWNFQWGEQPVTMEVTPFKFNFESSKTYSFFKLNEDGVKFELKDSSNKSSTKEIKSNSPWFMLIQNN